MQVSAHDVAREIRARTSGVDAMQLHKLLYLCQGWNLALNGERMFTERVEAWKWGPVIRRVWTDEKHHRAPPPPVSLQGEHQMVLDYVLARFGSLSAVQLMDLTHEHGPWQETRDQPGTNTEIPTEKIEHWIRSDEEFADRERRVARCRKTSRLSFAPIKVTPELEHAIALAQSGAPVVESRPE